MSIEELQRRYVALFGNEPAAADSLDRIEKQLQIVIPNDFKDISKVYTGGILGGVSHHSIEAGGSADNILDETIRIRQKTRIPMSMVVIAEPPESLVVLNEAGAGGPSVIWCDAMDVDKLNDLKTLHNPQTWETYADFFSFLLNREEKRRAR